MNGKKELRKLIGEPYFSRGVKYFASGKVNKFKVVSRAEIIGAVSGSGGRIYTALITLKVDLRGLLTEIEGDCSCPVGFNCKHVAALMLAAMDQLPAEMFPPEADVRPRDPALPGNVDVWLNGLREAAEKRRELASAFPVEKLYYVFSAENRALVTPVKARLLKRGDFGKNPQEYLTTTNLSYPPRFMTLDDVGILQKLAALRMSSWKTRFDWPEGDELFAILQEVIATGRARGFTLEGPRLHWGPSRQGRFEWRMRDNGDQRLALVGEDGAAMEVLPSPPPLYIDRETGACGPVDTGLAHKVAAKAADAPVVPPRFVRSLSERLTAEGHPVPPPTSISMRERKVAPVPVLLLASRRFRKSDWSDYRSFSKSREIPLPIARPFFQYEDHQVLIGQPGDPTRRDGHEIVVLRRDAAREARALSKLAEIEGNGVWKVSNPRAEGALPGEDVKSGDFLFTGPERNYTDPDQAASAGLRFALHDIPVLREEGWRIETEDSWPFRFHEGPLDFEAGAERSGVDWFSFALKVIVGDRELDLLPTILELIENLPVGDDGALERGFDLVEHLGNMDFYPRLDDGLLVAIPGKRLLPIVQAFLETHGLDKFHLAEAGRAAALTDALEGCGIRWKGGEELLALGRKLRALAQAPEVEPPAALKAELRPYQKAGFGWLRALSETGFGGVLADDMGLGKTVQALALLAQCHLTRDSSHPSLLIVPTSLVGNWRREAARFAPGLKLLVLHGPERKQSFGAIPHYHLVVTTYPLVRRDHEYLFAQQWELAILDEAQAVKNPAAATSKRIRDIKARQRIALTGTPMENNLAELWALFDWLVPGLLGNRAGFGKEFRTPIEKHGDRARQRLLSARVQPFLLRRNKEEVASDLPPKTEINEVVPLEGAQREFYETLRVAMDERVVEAIRRKGFEGSRITILDALLKLRQVCCDPALVKLDAARKVKDSAKRARLLKLLEELIAEGRKVLVFSQFVEMLKLIEQDIGKRKWDYAMLTGKTKNRDSQIEKFQQTDTPIFLISLKAGGTGLNLTAADTVLLYDPWWNPAVERQAMDRAHRIGQDKPVFVYKMIAEGTVETAIQSMQEKKQALADALFGESRGGPLALAEEDITALFAPTT